LDAKSEAKGSEKRAEVALNFIYPL